MPETPRKTGAAAPATPLRAIERAIETIVLASRWVQAPLYVGLIAVLFVVAVKFALELFHLFHEAVAAQEADLVLMVLSLVDLVMVGNLVVMVIISGYENFVSRLDAGEEAERLSWFGKLDSGSLKIKLASSIVAISSIHLLKKFLDAANYDNGKLYALVVMHMAFVLSALLLAWTDRIAFTRKPPDGKGAKE